ncbi:hypothetical protein EMCRGX_G009577 [Ephydatia muelleri]
MSRLESQMSQMFEEMKPRMRDIGYFRLPPREEIKGARGRPETSYTKRAYGAAGPSEFVDGAIAKLVLEGYVKVVSGGGKKRLVANLRHVNHYLKLQKFKYEDLQCMMAMLLFKPGDGCYTNVLMSWDRVEMGGMCKTSPLIEHTIPSNYTSNQSGPIINATCSGPQASPHNFNFSVVGWVLSIPVFTYAQMLHPGIPSLTHPIKQKKGLHWFMAAIFGTTLFCYMTLGIVVSLWFRGDINETASLNWVPLTKPRHHVALRALSYIIILFPTLDVISAYPVVTCSMVNNLYQVIMGRDTSQRKHSYDGLILVAMRAVVAILPIVCSLFISNLVYILKEPPPATCGYQDGGAEEGWGGGGAELTEGSEDELGRGKVGKKRRSPPPVAKGKSLYMTPYSILGLSHPVAVVMTGLLGGATFVIALVSLAYSVEPKCL